MTQPSDALTATVARAIKLEQVRGADVQSQARAAIRAMNEAATAELSRRHTQIEHLGLIGGEL